MVQGTLEKSSQQICKYYAKGTCRFGHNCKFIHTASSSNVGDRVASGTSQSGDTTSTTSGSALSQATARSDSPGVKVLPGINKPCRLWQGGSCRWGTKCRFRHDGEAGSFSVGEGGSATGTSDRVGDAPSADTDDVKAKEKERIEQRRKQEEDWAKEATVTIQKVLPGINQPCRLWQGGSCTWGTKCWFRHDGEAGSFSVGEGGSATGTSDRVGDAPSVGTGDVKAKEKERIEQRRKQEEDWAKEATVTIQKVLPGINQPCRLWQGGSCTWGTKCWFRHDGEAGSSSVGEGGSATGTSDRVGGAPSVDTDDVKAKEKERIEQRRKQEEDWAKEATVTIQKVVLNSFVQFEAGLTIKRVICGFEASQILVKNLPLNAQRSEVMALFTQQGVDPGDIAILKMDLVDGLSQATVLGRAAEVEVIALGLDGIEFRDENLEFVVCERNSDGCTMGSSNRDSYLSISYPKPSQTMIIKYRPSLDMYEAEGKKRLLSGRPLKGQTLRAALRCDDSDFDDDLMPRYSIQLSRIPADTTLDEVRTFAATRYVGIDTTVLSYTSDEVFSALESHLRGLPGSTFQRLTLDNSSRPRSVYLKAVFDTWESAKNAHDSLSGKILRAGFPLPRLFLSDPHQFVLSLDENQYNAQKAQWSELCEGKSKEAAIQTRTIDRVSGRKVIITLFGRDKKMVGALKVRIEGMAAGQRLDASYWHPTFKDPKRSNEFFDDLYHGTGAYVRTDWKHNCLTVSGTANAVEAAKDRIKEQVDRISAEQGTILLQRRALGFFIREGLAKMKGLLGEENVTLDVKSAQIVLQGVDLEEARHHFKQLMTTFLDRNASSSSSATASDEHPCPVCYDTVLQPFEIGCQHIYCSPCLRHYILSTLDSHTVPLKCMGNDATCNQPLSLPLIQRFLPYQRFEQLMEAAFRSYIDKNPEIFKYCTTPGCTQVYRATTSPQDLACPSCFAEVCTACFNEGHSGMTCAERRVHRDAGEQERLLTQWATERGVKKCPSCQAYVEKNDGCNHMSCKCGAHFCWICLGVFDSTHIYDHMAEVHGGIYNDPEPRVNARQFGAQPNVPDIVDVVGGPAAAAEQIAALRRIQADL